MSQTLYFGGPIVTMERELYVQALLTEGERILYAGSLHGAEERAEGTVRRVDLKGRALLPAFVDAHSHLTAYANTFLQAGLGECASWEELGRRLSAFAAREGLAPGEWVRGEGYDHNELAEGRHPARQLLDAACPGHPVMIQHRSGHVGVFNTLALERLGVNEETPCPPGGRMERGPDGKLTGYMEENAFLELQKRVPLPDTEDLLAAYDKAQRSYASYGVATVQEGMMPDQLIPLYRQLLERDLLWLDVVGYADADGQAAEAFSGHIRAYSGHFKLGGYKIFLDGSPQGRTAWMRTPYLGGGPQDRGYPVLTDRQVYDRMALALDQGMQLLAHCNGDAAAGQYLSVLEQLEREREAHLERPVMIHAQLLDLDQLDKVKELGVVLVVWPDRSVRLMCTLLGAALLICGLVYILGWLVRRREGGISAFTLIPGVVLSGLGIWLMTSSDSVIALVQYVFGAVVIFHGVLDVQSSVSLMRQGAARWWLDLALSALTLALGTLILINPFGTFAALVTLIGLVLIYDGLSDLWIIHRLSRMVRDLERDLNGDIIETRGRDLDE